ncbi:hypothetical protein BDZ91DRAFT_767734 [Kalaharituber pfeilii]|nr:hypothetical protein BDZ91DRAFT_767734 [Kalaharituber pfeilii]
MRVLLSFVAGCCLVSFSIAWLAKSSLKLKQLPGTNCTRGADGIWKWGELNTHTSTMGVVKIVRLGIGNMAIYALYGRMGAEEDARLEKDLIWVSLTGMHWGSGGRGHEGGGAWNFSGGANAGERLAPVTLELKYPLGHARTGNSVDRSSGRERERHVAGRAGTTQDGATRKQSRKFLRSGAYAKWALHYLSSGAYKSVCSREWSVQLSCECLTERAYVLFTAPLDPEVA